MRDYRHYADLGPFYYDEKLSFSDKARRMKGAILRDFDVDDDVRSALGRLMYSVSNASDDNEFDNLMVKLVNWGDSNDVYIELCAPGAKQP